MKHFLNAKAVAILVIISVVIIDYIVPLGISAGVLYIISLPILINEKRATILSFAVLISSFVLINFFYFAQKDTFSFIYINRILSICSIWIVAYILIRYKALKARKEAIKQKQQEALEEMLFITNHKVRHPISTLLGILEILNNPQFTTEQKIEVIKLVQRPIDDLNDFTKELSDFMAFQKSNYIKSQF